MAHHQVKPQDKIIEDFPLTPKDILSSFDVFGMSAAEFGVYCKILFVSWIQRPQCYLRLDVHNICELCNLTKEDWEQVQERVIKKFEMIYREGNTPYIYNKVLLGKWHDAINNNKKAKGKQLSAVAELLNYSFDQFWDDYDKKVGDKNRILPKWLKLSEADREAIKKDIPKRKELQPIKHLRPNPETYINGRRWQDEYIDYRKPEQQRAAPVSRTNADYDGQKSNPV
jgi:hypothetical protein